MLDAFTEKFGKLGGRLSMPASQEDILGLEKRLSLQLPSLYKSLLAKHNGCDKCTEEAVWEWWSCTKVTTYNKYRNEDCFVPCKIDISKLTPDAREIRLDGNKLILFCDSLIDAPTYGIYVDRNSPYHGVVFDTCFGSISARNFNNWLKLFIEEAEEGLLFEDI